MSSLHMIEVFVHWAVLLFVYRPAEFHYERKRWLAIIQFFSNKVTIQLNVLYQIVLNWKIGVVDWSLVITIQLHR